MTNEDMKQYEVEPDAFWQNTWRYGSGSDVMEQAVEHSTWRPVSSWGRDGYDLGSWPLVIVLFRTPKDGHYEVIYYVEGDITKYHCPTLEVRNQLVDTLAFFHWKWAGEDWVEGYETVDDLPAKLRGPFSWERLEREKKEEEEAA